MTTDDHSLLDAIVGALSPVPGMLAIVLGGSRARGTASERSDYDIGLYYEPDHPLDVDAVGSAASSLDDTGPARRVTALGGWGPWINGGGWLTVRGRRVDLLYRDLAKVRATIDACRAGRITRDYQPGHPHAFVSAIYMGEIACCRPLWDPAGIVATLKEATVPYPAALRRALCDAFLWEAAFALENARHGRGRDDASYVAGCCFRSVACLCQVLFALNGAYLLNEKGAVAAVDGLAHRPPEFSARVAAAFGAIGTAAAAIAQIEALVRETAVLVA